MNLSRLFSVLCIENLIARRRAESGGDRKDIYDVAFLGVVRLPFG